MSIKGQIAKVGAKLAPKLWLELEIARRNPHFEPEFWLLPRFCAGVRCAVDVGGNQGAFSYYMSKSAGEVHVFEPNPVCLGDIKRLQRPNVHLHAVALSDSRHSATLRFDPGNTGIGTIESANLLDRNPGIKQVVEIEVDCLPLDDFSLAEVSFIKIDVEGHEAAVVRGGLGTIGAFRPILLIESELRHNPNAFPEIEAMLIPLGYSAWRWADGRFLPTTAIDLPALQADGPAGYVNNFVFAMKDRLEAL